MLVIGATGSDSTSNWTKSCSITTNSFNSDSSGGLQRGPPAATSSPQTNPDSASMPPSDRQSELCRSTQLRGSSSSQEQSSASLLRQSWLGGADTDATLLEAQAGSLGPCTEESPRWTVGPCCSHMGGFLKALWSSNTTAFAHRKRQKST